MAYAMERVSQVGLEAEKAGAETAASNFRIFDTVFRETISDLINLRREVSAEGQNRGCLEVMGNRSGQRLGRQ